MSRDRGVAAGPVEAEQLHVGLRHRVGPSLQVQLPQDRSQPVAQLVELLAAPRGAHAARRREPLTREPFAEAQQDREAIAREDRDPAARAHRRRVEPLGRAAVERGEDRAVGQPRVEMQRAPLLEVAQVVAQVLVDRVQPQRGVVLAERLVVAAILDAPLRSLVGEEEVLGQLLAAPRAPRPAVGMTTVGNDARAHAARRAVERVLVAVRPVGAKRGGAAGEDRELDGDAAARVLLAPQDRRLELVGVRRPDEVQEVAGGGERLLEIELRGAEELDEVRRRLGSGDRARNRQPQLRQAIAKMHRQADRRGARPRR